jgi:ABC-type branched-subunit amino acid transport system ATPase component
LVGIIGPNGAGKTTFFNAITGVTAPTSGRLIARGHDLTGKAPHRYTAHGLARTFQTPRVFADMPVLLNIEFGLKFAGRRPRKYWLWGEEQSAPWALRDASSILALIGLSAQALLPASAITPSQQRLLEIGMALATRPRMLLLDEPMAGMGPDESARMVEMLRGLKSTLTILLIEHDMEAVFALADRITVLVYGRVIASDVPAAIRANAEVRKAYLGAPDERTQVAHG